jgi:hypothetical protein
VADGGRKFSEGKASEEVAAMCYSHREYEAREEARRKAQRDRERLEREGRREERGAEAGRPEPKKDRELVRA